MKRLILYFLLILASIYVGIKLYQSPGYILMTYQHWAIETTFWFGALVLLLVIFLSNLLLSLIKKTVHLPSTLRHWWRDRKIQNGIKLLNKGYSELLVGKWKKSQKHLLKSARFENISLINYITAAQAADAQKDFNKRDYLLEQARLKTDPKDYIIDIVKIKFFLQHNQWEEALTLLVKLREQKPRDPYILELLVQTYLAMHDWVHLQKILPEIKKHHIFDESYFDQLEKDTYLHLLQKHFFADFSDIQHLWNSMPKRLRHDPDIVIAYATHLNRWNRSSEAEELLRKELKRKFDNKLIGHYVTTTGQAPGKQLALSEKWLKIYPTDANLLKAIGILCLRNRLWGQARDYLEASLKTHATPETYSALGYVFEKLGDEETALKYYRKGLSHFSEFLG